MMNKPRLIQLVKIGQKHMGWDDDTYRAWLEKYTGKRSAKDCSEMDLSMLADLLRDMGALDKHGYASPAIPGGSGPDRPTQAQWRTALGLSKKLGMSGAVNDPALKTFCQRVAKVDNPRFLNRDGMHALISGLTAWHESRKKQSSKGLSAKPCC
ncbi:MAG: regulatory protein GemA [Sterolibacterium sp.]|jgi:hypothetical protein